ncbi:hypothetical protein J5N97_010145 [Dioscorea zingiberensis]|uniref:Uncharacterized protein n=1 Tax=Dioscorea zingiberensis TaxID=325984 RepID=A0A9D5CXW2_9LILI|nr:hypothetical protein J5N97_010145 [Dioscorea zingiberensis]
MNPNQAIQILNTASGTPGEEALDVGSCRNPPPRGVLHSSSSPYHMEDGLNGKEWRSDTNSNVGDPHYDPLFPFNFGLTTGPKPSPSAAALRSGDHSHQLTGCIPSVQGFWFPALGVHYFEDFVHPSLVSPTFKFFFANFLSFF